MWETDQSCPDITILPRLAEIFGCTTDELLGISRQEAPIAELASQDAAQQEQPPKASKWRSLQSPGAAFGFWLFLTGLVIFTDAVCLPPYDLADIGLADAAISCGIFAFGLSSLFRRFSLLRLGCAMSGFVFVFTLLTEPGIGDMGWRVPLAAGLALFGLDLLIDTLRGRRPVAGKGHWDPSCMKNHWEIDAGRFDCATSFGEDRRLVTLPLLSGGQAVLSFGELTIDLTGCGEFSENCRLELRCDFGELNVLLPRTCRAEVNVRTAFAACDTYGAPCPDAASLIYVNGSASFGHITLQYL